MSKEEPIYEVREFDNSNSSDPEANEVISEFVNAFGRGAHRWPRLSLDELPGWERLLAKDAGWNRRCVLALAEQTAHWAIEDQNIRAAYEAHGTYYHYHSGENGIVPDSSLWAIREALAALLRRSISLTDEDLAYLARVCIKHKGNGYRGVPPAAVQKQVEIYSKRAPIEGNLRETLLLLAEYTRELRNADKKVASRLDFLLQSPSSRDQAVVGQPPIPAPVGLPTVLTALKQYLGVSPIDHVEESIAEGDGFPVRVDSPLAYEHKLLSNVILEYANAFRVRQDAYRAGVNRDKDLKARTDAAYEGANARATELLLTYVEGSSAKLLMAAYERHAHYYIARIPENSDYYGYRVPVEKIITELSKLSLPLDRQQVFDRILYLASVRYYLNPIDELVVQQVELQAETKPLSEGERWAIHRLRSVVIDSPPMGAVPEIANRLSKLIDGDATLLLVPGERWAERVHTDLSEMDGQFRTVWIDIIKHAYTADSSAPSGKWSKALAPLVTAIGTAAFRQQLIGWFGDVPSARSFKVLGGYAGDARGAADTFNDGNATVLRGLVWAMVTVADANTPRVVSELLATCIKKVPGVGPRAVKVANACVWALGELASLKEEVIRINALGQLARLKARVTFKTTLKAIEKALDKAAAESGIPRDEIEEMAVPTYGLEEVGKRVEQLGDFTAELVVTGTTSTELRWLKPDGKPQKSVPKSVKDHFADDLKELKSAAKDIEKMLPALRDRIDLLHLKQKTWAYDTWLERYLEHPLVGTVARRLIWQFDEGEHKPKVAATWLDGKLVDAGGDEVNVDSEAAIVSLWHPIGHDEANVLAWRRFFEDRQIKQPFKQAHREIYLLTDAERNTGVYSNRYASHVVKQHQYNALCGIRGWSNQLRLMVDADYAPTSIRLPEWNLRAEFWVEGVGDGYGTDTNESGTFLYLSTDQVRFYSLDAAANAAHAGGGGYGSRAAGPGTNNVNEPLPLDQIPPLVLSEILRDVDLFVGVASVGNDPTWNDGGPEGRYRTYWQETSFGDLTATAQTRREILQRLIPRLKIADRCTFDDKFLVVRGERRTYKIHLGSSNILMEPNDQYLCIVPGRGEGGGDKVFLPFEGDQRLAVILSKAMMLAEDTKITDPTILSQIGRK